ncbi:MAG TPA: hypothetical protein VLJ68_07905 [Chitinophagaceae bacterium]|nr:hypothetical protein [Chitinophagaceae bacterium]
MKKILSLLFVLAALSITNRSQAQQPVWKEMEDFHTVMSETFHPAEEGKLGPIRARSAEMVTKASAWKSSDAPNGFNKVVVKKQLKKLVKGSKEIDRLVVAKAADKVITEKLSALHDIFHDIMEKCRM